MERRRLSGLPACSFLAVVLLAGCAGAVQGDSLWIETGRHPAYPQDRFLVGVGWADTMDRADDRARGEIAKYFKSKIVSVTMDEEKYHQVDEGGERRVTHEFVQKIHSRIRAEAELEGVVIVQREVRQGQQYSLAVLDKVAQRRILAQRVAEMEMEMEERLAVPVSPPGPRIKALARVLFLHNSRARTARQLRLLGGRIDVDHEFAEETALEVRRLLATHFAVQVKSASEDLAAALGESIVGCGLVVTDGGAGRILVDGALDMQEGADDRGRPRVSYQVRLSATLGSEQIAGGEFSERIIHTSMEGARMKALYEIKERAVGPFVTMMEGFLLGDFAKEEKK
jgi:hypothetical protein